MSRLRAWALALACVLTLAACSDPPDHGTVTGQHHDPAWVQLMPIYGPNGQVIGFNQIWHPERWAIHVTNGTDAGWLDVSKHTYDLCGVGAPYPTCSS